MTEGKVTIWGLVQRCAEELTRNGQTPFSRGELIRCIQRTNPEYGSDSINPIIQGVTDNLKGGAPGAVGKNILHSVSRGQFVLLSHVASTMRTRESAEKPTRRSPSVAGATQPSAGESISLDSLDFGFICRIEPHRDRHGSIEELFPQCRFDNQQALPLNKYGDGPFCKFKIPNGLDLNGVYAILVDESLKYIGECEYLTSRYNMGYGNISPRNCFRGGQETNCRINNLILRAAKGGSTITLWFHESSRYKEIERALRETLRPKWNRA
jgi:hypothetical protein